MKTSVVISTYNGERYLLRQLESIRDQTHPVDEVLISDDCSTDKTPILAQQFIKENNLSGWRVEVNEHNKGWRRNFMEAMWRTSGDLIFTCDQDDVWRPDKVAKMYKLMAENPEMKALTSNWCKFYSNGKTEEGPRKSDGQVQQIVLYTNYMLVRYPGCAYCVRRQIVDWSKDYWAEGYPHDALLYRLGLFSDSLYEYHDVLFDWRMHSDSTFSVEAKDLKTIGEKKKWIATAKRMNNAMIRFVKDHHFDNSAKSLDLLTDYNQWLQIRGNFYEHQNILTGLRLMFYWRFYPRKRQYLGDWYLIFIKRK